MTGETTSEEDTSELTIYDFDPNNVPPEYLQAVGLVAMASASTESAMSDVIGGLCGLDNIEALALSTHMSVPLKDHVARALIELNAGSIEILDQVDDLLDDVTDAMDRRNAIIHNELITDPKTGQILSHRLKARGSVQLELRPISVEEIKEDARLIYEAGLNLIAFMGMLGIHPRERKIPLREPVKRSQKARAERRDLARRKRDKLAE
jgi:hypothetical protein